MKQVRNQKNVNLKSNLLRKFNFSTDYYEAEQLLKDVDVHSVTGIFKSYLRELPETLFTDVLYRRFIETFNQFSNINENELGHELQKIFVDVPPQSKVTINYILDHLLRYVFVIRKIYLKFLQTFSDQFFCPLQSSSARKRE